MKQCKSISTIISLVVLLSFMIPSMLVLPISSASTINKAEKTPQKIEELEQTNVLDEKEAMTVSVYRAQTEAIDNLPLEEYVAGVVASEMPAEFEMEALKAQALAARTYIVKKLMATSHSDTPKDADVTDTVQHQVYKDEKGLKEMWGEAYEVNMKKITEAVKATEGKIMTYNDQPIFAAFFSISNGFTENAGDYWEEDIPYLKAIESPWDKQVSTFLSKKRIPIREFEEKLGVKLDHTSDIGIITARTPGNRVAKVSIKDKEFSGRDIREKLDLRSSDFYWEKSGDHIIITTKGYGHGVGLSQYGANEMAKEGRKYKEIVSHYYRGIEISSSDSYLSKQVARK